MIFCIFKLETYSSLPKEVLSVGHRIGLRQKVAKTFVDTILPKNIDKEEFRYNTYLLFETHNSFNKREKQLKCKNGLTAKQRKLLFKLKNNDIKYETFEKINVLWHKYIDSVINEIKSNSDQIKLIRADFHGSYFIVYSSKNPTLVGIKGFVVQETKNTLKIVDKDDRLLGQLSINQNFLLIICFI